MGRRCLYLFLVGVIHLSASTAAGTSALEAMDQNVESDDYDEYSYEPDSESEFQKRSNGLQFGLGKRAYNFGLGKRAYNFGLGKRGQHYGFGLGKRGPVYTFGLGKREQMDNTWQRPNGYSFGLGKRSGKYNFGLGKRSGQYSFGLGKRSVDETPEAAEAELDAPKLFASGYNKRGYKPVFGLGKRPYSFGLGKRSDENFADSAEADESNPVDKRAKCANDCRLTYPSYTYALRKLREQQKIRGTLGKRGRADTPDSSRFLKRFPAYTFGLGKRSSGDMNFTEAAKSSSEVEESEKREE